MRTTERTRHRGSYAALAMVCALAMACALPGCSGEPAQPVNTPTQGNNGGAATPNSTPQGTTTPSANNPNGNSSPANGASSAGTGTPAHGGSPGNPPANQAAQGTPLKVVPQAGAGTGDRPVVYEFDTMLQQATFIPGTTLLAVCDGVNVFVCDLQSKRQLSVKLPFKGTGRPQALFASSQGSLVAGLVDNDIVVFDVASGKERARGKINRMLFSSAGFAGERIIFSEPAQILNLTDSSVTPLGIEGAQRLTVTSADGKWLACDNVNDGERQHIRLFNAVDLSEAKTLSANDGERCGKSGAFSADGKLFAAGVYVGEDGANAIRIWNVESGELVHQVAGTDNTLTRMSFSVDGKKLIALGGPDQVLVYELDTQASKSMTISSNPSCIAISPDGSQIVAVSGFELQVWDIPSLQ